MLKDVVAILEQRGGQYGQKYVNFDVTADMWSSQLTHWFGTPIRVTRRQVAMMMECHKVARQTTSPIYVEDNYDDTAGYAEIAREMHVEEESQT